MITCDVLVQFPEGGYFVHAAAVLQQIVEEYDLRPEGLHLLQPFLHGARGLCLVAPVLKPLRQRVAYEKLIVYDKSYSSSFSPLWKRSVTVVPPPTSLSMARAPSLWLHQLFHDGEAQTDAVDVFRVKWLQHPRELLGAHAPPVVLKFQHAPRVLGIRPHPDLLFFPSPAWPAGYC